MTRVWVETSAGSGVYWRDLSADLIREVLERWPKHGGDAYALSTATRAVVIETGTLAYHTPRHVELELRRLESAIVRTCLRDSPRRSCETATVYYDAVPTEALVAAIFMAVEAEASP